MGDERAHTPTPWHVHRNFTHNTALTVRIEADETMIAYRKVASKSIEEANFDHIVLCVNAWDDPEALRARLRTIAQERA